MQKITPFFWFDGNAEAAATFYVETFGEENAKITDRSYYGADTPMPEGTLLTASLNLFGQEFVALNAGPMFKFTPAISFMVTCEDQAELDRYWDKLIDGGEPMQCGWITDKFGVTWQITPRALREYLEDDDREKAQRVMQAMMQMVKLDIPTLERAYRGE